MLNPDNNYYKTKQIDKLAGSLLGVASAVIFVFTGVSIASIGLPVIVFLILSCISIVLLFRHGLEFKFDSRILEILFLYFIFSVVYALSFFIASSNFESEDLHFLVANMANIGWVPIFYIIVSLKRGLVITYLAWFSFGISIFLIGLWLMLAIHFSDLFFMRYEHVLFSFEKNTLFHNPNYLARQLLLVICLLYGYFLMIRLDKKQSLLVIVLIVALMIMVVSTLSRTNIVALVAFLFGVYLYEYKGSGNRLRSSIKYLMVAVVLSAILVFISPDIRERLGSTIEMFQRLYYLDETWSLPRRFRTWIATIDIIKNHPFFGVGLSDVTHYLELSGSVMYFPGMYGRVIAIHGGFMKIAAYGGLVTLFMYAILYVRMYIITKKLSIPDTVSGSYAYTLRLLLIILFICNLSADSLGLPLTWMSIGLLMALSIPEKKSHDNELVN